VQLLGALSNLDGASESVEEIGEAGVPKPVVANVLLRVGPLAAGADATHLLERGSGKKAAHGRSR
jgi:hypothetical protein